MKKELLSTYFKRVLFFCTVFFYISHLNAQSITASFINYATPSTGVLIDFTSSNSALLVPRLTPSSVSSPQRGMIVYDQNKNMFTYHNGSNWIYGEAYTIDASGNKILTLDGKNIIINGDNGGIGTVTGGYSIRFTRQGGILIGDYPSGVSDSDGDSKSPLWVEAMEQGGMGTTGNATAMSIGNNGNIERVTTPTPTWGPSFPYFKENRSIYARGNIITASRFMAVSTLTFSDARIKNILSRSNSLEDLGILNKLKITNYTYKDSIQKGREVHKKVIAQEVEEIYPQAVSKTYEWIPNIYRGTKNVVWNKDSILIAMDTIVDVAVGDKIQLYNQENKRAFVQVLSVKDNVFTVKGLDKTFVEKSPLFVYGKEVYDFRVVDYEALAMLNVSATQELSKEIDVQQQEIESLKKELAELKKLLKKK